MLGVTIALGDTHAGDDRMVWRWYGRNEIRRSHLGVWATDLRWSTYLRNCFDIRWPMPITLDLRELHGKEEQSHEGRSQNCKMAAREH